MRWGSKTARESNTSSKSQYFLPLYPSFPYLVIREVGFVSREAYLVSRISRFTLPSFSHRRRRPGMRDCVAIFICHCETPLRRCGNLNIFKDLRDCFGRCTPSQRHCDTVSCAGQASGVYVHMLRKPTTPQACPGIRRGSLPGCVANKDSALI